MAREPRPDPASAEVAATEHGKEDAAPRRPVPPEAGASADELGRYLGEVRLRLQAGLDYPFAARRMKLAGVVHVRLRITGDGAVEERSIAVIRSSGAEVLDAAAISTVQRALPFPPPPGGRGMIIEVPVAFDLVRG